VVEEVVLPDRAHVGVDALADLAAELLQRRALPLRRGLDDLRVQARLDAESAGELDRRARPVPVEHVVDAALAGADEGDLDELEVQRLRHPLLHVVLDHVECTHALLRRQQRLVVGREDLGDLGVGADARAGQVCLLVLRHGITSRKPTGVRYVERVRLEWTRKRGGYQGSPWRARLMKAPGAPFFPIREGPSGVLGLATTALRAHPTEEDACDAPRWPLSSSPRSP
jgi:hypothetical protein